MKVEFIRDDSYLRVDPETEAFFLAMDHHDRHAGHHMICRNIYAAAKGEIAAADDELTGRGVAVVRQAIDPGRASHLSALIDAEITTAEYPNTNIDPQGQLRRELVGTIPEFFTPSVTNMIENYLGCHFRIIHCQLYRTQTGGEPHVSFLWHRDMEPMAQVHVMLYLTPSGHDDPGTEFCTLADSTQFARKGYAYPSFEERVLDLSTLLDANDPPPQTFCPDLDAGDATVFGAPRILHRGLDGDGGYRDVFLINLLPSLVPWQNDLDYVGTDQLFWTDRSSNTLQTNPFTPTLEQFPVFTGERVADWVILGDMLPEKFDS